ncbi:uncharacterized protein JCM15063_000844 [Sporobolomyces koalae]|uniref:uncharacterized protein n=1 Tax=Sporobolomyces koalae TaxID=500713 RepID=UPI003176B798
MSVVIPLNARVETSSGPGVVRFVGPTLFATGKWVGVHLDVPAGKNDGSVAGTRYFTCPPNSGVFVRDRMVTLLPDDDARVGETFKLPPSRPTSSRPSSSASNPSRAHSRTSISRPLSSTSSSSSSMPPPPAPSSLKRPSSSTSSASRTSTTIATASPRRSSSIARSAPAAAPPTAALARPAPPMTPRTSSTSRTPATPASTSAPTSRTPSRTPSLSRPNFAPSTPIPTPTPTRTLKSSSSTDPASITPSRTSLKTPTTAVSGTSSMQRTLSGESTSSRISSTSSSSVSRIGTGLRQPGLPRPGGSSSRITPGAKSSIGTTRPTVGVRALSRGSLAAMQDEQLHNQDGDELEDPDEPVQDEESRTRSPFKRPESIASSHASSTFGPSTRGEPEDPLSLKGSDPRRTAAEAMVPKREYDALSTRLQILERRRNEDRDKVREYEKIKDEQAEWDRLRDKIKSRLEVVVGENKEIKRENKELGIELESLQSKFEDLQEQVEHHLLDKEIAESELEEEKAQRKTLEERIGELETEVTVFREENARLEGPPAEEGDNPDQGNAVSSIAYRQLEKQNLRLKDALLRLRDLTTEAETEAKKKIETLEKELDLSSDLQGDLDNMAVELEESEAKVEELKAQLDAAAEAQDMLEELTDRNIRLQDDNEILKVDIEELEALRELADELEESHLETEKQLQEESDLKDLLIQDLKRRNDSLEDSCVDFERTISQFREVVISLQGDLEELRRQQSTQASESQSLSSQSQAMLNLNMRLQSSVLKSQVKAIDLELRKLEAKQASEHLAIVKPYLLHAFFESDSDAVEALLFFNRLAYKSDLLTTSIEQNMSINEALDGIVPEDFVGICETRAKLGHYASLNKRFAANLTRCSPEIFLKMGRVYRELASNEKKLDGFIELLRKEEFKAIDCGRDLDGLIAQSEHLAETHLADLDPTLDLAEREVSCVATLDLDFDIIAVAAGFTKQTIAAISQDPEIELQLGDASLDDLVFKPLQNLVNHARNAKVVTKKLLRRFDDLVSASSAIGLEHAEGFETLAYNSTAIAQAVSKLGSDVSAYCTEIRATKQPFEVNALVSIAQEIAAVELGKQSARPLEEINSLVVQLVTDVGTTLSASLEAERVVQLSYSAPWMARVAQIQSDAAINVEAERKVIQLNEEMRELAREVRTKEEAYQESAVKIELLEKRLEGVKKQADVLAQLETDLAKSRKQERTYEEANEVLQRDLDAMEQELVKLKQNVGASEKTNGTASASGAGGDPAAYEGNLETAYLVDKITSLRSAVKFLRSENSYLKSQDLLSDLDAIPLFELPPTPPLTPEPCSDSEHEAGPTGTSSLSRRSESNPKALAPQSFAVRSKLLLQEARLVLATPRLVDLSQVSASQGDRRRKAWTPARRDPRNQLWAERERGHALERKMLKLCEAR